MLVICFERSFYMFDEIYDNHTKIDLDSVFVPQKGLVSAVYNAFLTIDFLPLPEGLTLTKAHRNTLFESQMAPAIRVNKKSGKYELIAGFRTFQMAKVFDQKTVSAVVYDELHEAFATKIAIDDCILCMSLFTIKGNKVANRQVEKFINDVRSYVPAQYKTIFPRKNEVREWLGLTFTSIRKKYSTQSELEWLREWAEYSVTSSESRVSDELPCFETADGNEASQEIVNSDESQIDCQAVYFDVPIIHEVRSVSDEEPDFDPEKYDDELCTFAGLDQAAVNKRIRDLIARAEPRSQVNSAAIYQ